MGDAKCDWPKEVELCGYVFVSCGFQQVVLEVAFIPQGRRGRSGKQRNDSDEDKTTELKYNSTQAETPSICARTRATCLQQLTLPLPTPVHGCALSCAGSSCRAVCKCSKGLSAAGASVSSRCGWRGCCVFDNLLGESELLETHVCVHVTQKKKCQLSALM